MATKFKIITPAYNCAKAIKTTLYSIIGQTYNNWEMIVLDDMSTDDTAKVVKDLAVSLGIEDQVFVKTRTEKYGEVRNTVEEVSLCGDDDVIVRLDAGDFITDLGCLQILDYFYAEHNPAVLWTNHRWRFTDTNISGPIDPEVSFYEQPWRTSHLKTFRASDFKGLNHANFLDSNGEYIMLACDQAVFLPMLERARLNKRPLMYLPVTMYHYDTEAADDPSVFHRPREKKQKVSAEWIRARGYIE
tara:strand:+ start:941 stop:1675 length:735 start_codon:yes stop_codon:yes gene_type:complete